MSDRTETLSELMRILDSIWLDISQLAEYLNISKATIYKYVSLNRIPYHKIPGSSKLLFKRIEIDDWIEGKIPEPNHENIKEIADKLFKNI